MIDLPAPLDATQRDDDVRVRMVHRAIAFVHALRLQLRDQRDDTVLQRWLTAAEFEQTRSSLNPASTLMLHMGATWGSVCARGRSSPAWRCRWMPRCRP